MNFFALVFYVHWHASTHPECGAAEIAAVRKLSK